MARTVEWQVKRLDHLEEILLVLTQLVLKSEGFKVKDRRTDNYIEITKNGITNYFYLYLVVRMRSLSGKDEKSYQLVQGLTAVGFFFDEVVLQPQSFVNQATTRIGLSKTGLII